MTSNVPASNNMDSVGKEQRSSANDEQEQLSDNRDIQLSDEQLYDIPVSDDTCSTAIEYAVEAEFIATPELRELAMKWGATYGDTGKLVNNTITMGRKEYLKHIKSLTREQVIDDPLVYILFRSEEQGEVNFFTWLEKFPKGKEA